MEKQMDRNFTFLWIIENFSMCLHSNGQRFCSLPFVSNSLPGIKWCIELYPRRSAFKNYVALYLTRKDNLLEDCKINFSFQFLDCNEKEIPGIMPFPTTTRVFEKNGSTCGHAMVAERDLLLRSLTRDILVVKCNLEPPSETNDEEKLSLIPYKNALYTDIVLRARDGEFNVHKAMLWARWPELAKKLDQEKSFEQDFYIGSNILEAMIEYVYTGRVSFKGYMFFEELTVTAAKYGLRILNPASGIIKTCKTRINVEEISCVLPIEDFSSLAVNTQLHYEFNSDNWSSCKWSLRVRICKKTETDQIFSVFICGISDYEFRPFFIRTKISFDDSNFSENEHLLKHDEKWECAEFSRTISTLQKDVLFLRCEFKVASGSLSSDYVKSFCVYETSMSHSNLNRNLRNLYEKGTLSDVTIVVDSIRFPVHKFILCSQSSVFRRMFETEMIESRNNQVEISDVDPNIIHKMLLFLYSGNIEEICVETAMQLYTAADKYDVSALKKKCSSFLKSNTTVKNVFKILQLAEMHYDDHLLQNAFDFLSDHRQEIFSTKELEESSKKYLYAKLLQDVLARTHKPTK